MFIFQEWTLREQLVLMTPKCDFISKFEKKWWFCIYTSLCSTRATIFPFRRFPGRLTQAYYMICIYIYIFRWWLDTAGSVSPKGRLRLDGVCCDWAFALLCYDVGSVTTGTPAHHPTLWLCVGDVGIWTSVVCCGMAHVWRSPSFWSVAILLIY